MFTGLIESVGEVAEVKAIDAGYRLRIASGIAGDLRLGESVAVNGVCLTVVEQTSGSFSAEIGPETAKVTSLGDLQSRALVNLERAMPANGRFGGHMVLGHVDGTGTIQSIRPEADFWWVTVSYPAALAPYLIHRGSVAIDGISLTINDVTNHGFSIAIIPHTAKVTTLGLKQVNDTVNLESDLIGKYVERLLQERGQLPQKPAPVIDKDYLQKRGLL